MITANSKLTELQTCQVIDTEVKYQ